EPEDAMDAEVITQHLFEVRAAQSRVAGLHRVEETLFRGQQQALAIDVDAASFQNNAPLPELRLPGAQTERIAHLVRNGVVALPIGILGPGVEAPVGESDRALRRAEKYRPKIAGPGPVRGKPKEIDLAEVDGALSQRPPGSPLGPGVVDQDADALRLVQVAHD